MEQIIITLPKNSREKDIIIDRIFGKNNLFDNEPLEWLLIRNQVIDYDTYHHSAEYELIIQNKISFKFYRTTYDINKYTSPFENHNEIVLKRVKPYSKRIIAYKEV